MYRQMIRLLTEKNRILIAGIEAICIFCLIGLGMFDIDRGTDAINIFNTTMLNVPQLIYIGILWVLFAFFEFYLVLSQKFTKVVEWYRMSITAFIPSYIIFKVKILGVQLYSADIFIFIIIPICQIVMLVISGLDELHQQNNKHLSEEK